MVFSELSPQILGLIIVRRLLDLIFSQHDLAWIDNILPEKEKKEADKKKRRKGAHEDSDEEVVRMGGLSWWEGSRPSLHLCHGQGGVTSQVSRGHCPGPALV